MVVIDIVGGVDALVFLILNLGLCFKNGDVLGEIFVNEVHVACTTFIKGEPIAQFGNALDSIQCGSLFDGDRTYISGFQFVWTVRQLDPLRPRVIAFISSIFTTFCFGIAMPTSKLVMVPIDPPTDQPSRGSLHR